MKKRVFFPVRGSAEMASALRSKVERAKLRGARQDAIDAINALNPYKGGNDTLWRLHHLNNIDKHRRWLIIGSKYRSVDIAPVIGRAMVDAGPGFADALKQMGGLWLKAAASIEPAKPGDALFTDAPDAEGNEDIKFAFDVAIHEPEIAEGEPLIPTLHQLSQLVRDIIDKFAPLLVR